MQFKIGDFIVYTDKSKEELSEKVAVPTSLKSGKPSKYEWQNKTREITVFSKLELREKKDSIYNIALSDIFDFIDLIEVLKAFNGNKLDTDKEYNINDKFTAKTASKNGKISLKLHFKNYSYSLFLDKFECSSLAAKFGKILSRCEVWQESEA